MQGNLSGKNILKSTLIIISIFILHTWILPLTDVGAQRKYLSHDDIFSISFSDEKHGWACGRWGTILYTVDGGMSWDFQRSHTDFTLADIFFIDNQNGWATGNEGIIIHTTDGGETWVSQESPVSGYHAGIFFVTPMKGWIVSDQTQILATKDGGKTWKVQFKDVEFKLKAISFVDESNGWTAGEYGYIYHTDDGGATWEHQGGYLRFNEETADLEGGTFLYDVLAVDYMTAWAVGLDGRVTKTVDGGKTWTDMDIGAPRTPLFCIARDKTNTIVIGGKGVFMVSVDGGHTWENARFKPHIDYSWIYGVTHCGGSKFTAGGENGAIYMGTGNKEWKRIDY